MSSRPRWVLHAEASTWRFLMDIGMALEKYSSPQPPPSSFIKIMKTSISPIHGEIKLHFYVPDDYHNRGPDQRYPVIVSFHGGGWTIGKPTDDARWAAAVIKYTSAICVAVDYRLAPEHPFPIPNDDAADAVLWLARNAKELGINSKKIVLSGFSSGGSISFTSALKIQDHLRTAGVPHGIEADGIERTNSGGRRLSTWNQERGRDIEDVDNLKIKGIISFYPPVDFTQTRAERRATNINPDKSLSAIFTDLFDSSYLYPPDVTTLSSPFLSPAVADTELLLHLPDDIIVVTCEFDDLNAEGLKFVDRLRNEVGKNVTHRLVTGQPHAWDKNPFGVQPQVYEVYEEVLTAMQKVLDQDDDSD